MQNLLPTKISFFVFASGANVRTFANLQAGHQDIPIPIFANYLLGDTPKTPTFFQNGYTYGFKKGEDMQERKHGVERLLRAIEQNIDDNNISTLARLLNYHEPQLREDIEAIKLVEISNKEND